MVTVDSIEKWLIKSNPAMPGGRSPQGRGRRVAVGGTGVKVGVDVGRGVDVGGMRVGVCVGVLVGVVVGVLVDVGVAVGGARRGKDVHPPSTNASAPSAAISDALVASIIPYFRIGSDDCKQSRPISITHPSAENLILLCNYSLLGFLIFL